ncbi:L-piperidine-6-carboxylate dehydrogenase [Lignipirellula cremea]|uniref:Succinate-semialdehyde dehydrogenase [NADP(+)] GabD n=1 Tax=Lignipirellula cremea TaxID=2528010 RepID=A0A518DTE8_9BACT|nr:aldehyde dehydrogenase family protein [Lignipirellula cremea]QDU95104.1 Succinate-semialdehyde dehydrogenase [NADP(+)] GabD [Lignipirellula cremea]
MFSEVLERLGIQTGQPNFGLSAPLREKPGGEEIVSLNPANGETIARVATATRSDYDALVDRAGDVFLRWRSAPPPERGELIRRFGLALRERKQDLGLLVTLETGKILTEGEGEVQEMIDMCDFAVGLSRQLYGLTMACERPDHRLFEQWRPLGPVGVLTAFNFPVAVWAWNAAVAAVCGDPVVWKPSPHTPLTAIAVQKIAEQVAAAAGWEGVFQMYVAPGHEGGQWMASDPRLPLVSATGSCEMGRSVAQQIAARLGRSLLELGGNNGLIVCESANLDLSLRAVAFAAAGAAGQRCTSLRRLFLHRSIAGPFTERLKKAYAGISQRIGNPWEDGVLMGPLINEASVERMLAAVSAIGEQGGQILCGGKRLNRPGSFVEPTLVQATCDMPITREETFAPILYLFEFDTLEEAIEQHNAVSQGLSSAIFTDRLQEAERFLSPAGSDCGIANVNIGTSGAEIGGAFGGDKDTGGGREAGSDAWKAYMRRQTCTVNYGDALPLAQGVKFEI